MDVQGEYGINSIFADQVDVDMPVIFGDVTIQNPSVSSSGITLAKDVLGKIGLRDHDGNVILEADTYDLNGEYDGLEMLTFCNGLLLVRQGTYEAQDLGDGRKRVHTDSVYGYINKQGEEVIPLQFSKATVFSEGMAFVLTKDGVYKYIGTDGTDRIVFPEDLSVFYATPFHNGYAIVMCDYQMGIIRAPQE